MNMNKRSSYCHHLVLRLGAVCQQVVSVQILLEQVVAVQILLDLAEWEAFRADEFLAHSF